MPQNIDLFRKNANSHIMSDSEYYLGGDPGSRGGDPNSKKIGIFGGIKLQIFGAEGAENFEKLRFLMEIWLFFGVLSENLA